MAFVALMVRFDVSVMAFRSMAFVTVLTGLSLIDLKTFEIPDGFHYAAILLFLGTAFFHPYRESLYGMLTGCIFSCGMLLLSMLFDRISGTESLGGGDVKLFFTIGLFLQHPFLGLLHLILSCCLGLLFSLCIRKERIPFGPSISMAAFITLLFGQPVMDWYMKLLF
jgi:leader peptidase (prepilin peptidase)/N-methyltransferase